MVETGCLHYFFAVKLDRLGTVVVMKPVVIQFVVVVA